MQVLFAAMLINTLHAALENRKVTFKRVSMDLATAIFAGAVIDIFVARKIVG
jgi:hypothetical protein